MSRNFRENENSKAIGNKGRTWFKYIRTIKEADKIWESWKWHIKESDEEISATEEHIETKYRGVIETITKEESNMKIINTKKKKQERNIWGNVLAGIFQKGRRAKS